ncbi:uroplakin-3b-like protein 1 [Pelobates fuscus]|uniref:uroplakin-3b-like protein 1 n=1 Tax=Pelobates fuscus TaxID=191477 RepID=UPI002FE4CAB3
MMSLCVKLCLILVALTPSIADISSYVPQITQKVPVGNLTSSTFLLDQPQCVFNTSGVNEVWLVVALNSVTPTLKNENLGVPVNCSSFPVTKYYYTLRVIEKNYPCNLTNNVLAVLDVGSQTNCTDIQFCNCPLHSTDVYRVKFVVLNNTGFVGATNWSSPIKLKEVMNYTSITLPLVRSEGMIVLTAILGILLAVLLICIIVALFIGSRNIFWHGRLESNKLFSTDLENRGTYKKQPLHNVYIG